MADFLQNDAEVGVTYDFRDLCKLFPEAPESYLYAVLLGSRKNKEQVLDELRIAEAEGFIIAFAALFYYVLRWVDEPAKVRAVLSVSSYLEKYASREVKAVKAELQWHVLVSGDRYIKPYEAEEFYNMNEGTWHDAVPLGLTAVQIFLDAVYGIWQTRLRQEERDARAIAEAAAEQAEAERTTRRPPDVRNDVAGDSDGQLRPGSP